MGDSLGKLMNSHSGWMLNYRVYRGIDYLLVIELLIFLCGSTDDLLGGFEETLMKDLRISYTIMSR